MTTSKYNVVALSGPAPVRAIEIPVKTALEYAAGLTKAGRRFGQQPGEASSALKTLSQISASDPVIPSVLHQIGEAHMPQGLESVTQAHIKGVIGEIANNLGMVDKPSHNMKNIFSSKRKGMGISRKP